MAAVHKLVGQLTRRLLEGVRCKLFPDNYFCSCSLFNNISTRKINCCSTVCENCKGMAHVFEHKLVQVKWSDTPEMARINYIGMEKQKTDWYVPTTIRKKLWGWTWQHHSLSSSAEVKNEWACTFISSVCFHGMYRNSFIDTFTLATPST